jgi:cation transport regulator ChaB
MAILRRSRPDAQEEVAHKVACAAVKRRYRKVGDVWRPR